MAQDNPFGSDDSGFDFGVPEATTPAANTPAGAASTLDPLPADANIVTRMLRENPPKDLIGIARAIELTARLNNWSEAGRYLDQIAAQVDKPGAMQQLGDRFGTQLWLTLSFESELTAEQRTTAKKVLDAINALQNDQGSLTSALQQLASPSAVVRKRSALRIQQAGDVGLKQLIDGIANSSIQPSDIVVDLIDTFRQSGWDALAAALTTDDQAARDRLLVTSCAFVDRGLLPQLSAALFDPAVNADVKSAIKTVFQRVQSPLPTAGQTRDYLQQQIVRELTHAASVANDLVSEPLNNTWLRKLENQRLDVVLLSLSNYHLQRAAELSIVVLQMSEGIDEAAVLATTTLLQRDYAMLQILSPIPIDLRTDKPLQNRAEVLGARTKDIGFWVSVYKTSEVNHFAAARLRAIQQLGSLTSRSDQSTEVTEVLIDAVADGVPAVRFAALEILLRLQQVEADPRIEYVLDRARRTQPSISSSPTALVVGGETDLRNFAKVKLAELGIETIEASSGREAIQTIQRIKPFEFMLVVDRLYDMPLSQLLQRVQAYPATASIPIAVLTPEITAGEQSIIGTLPNVIFGSLSKVEDAMQATVREMNRSAAIPLPSRTDRLIWTGLLRENIQ